jgi:hypothetical protein
MDSIRRKCEMRLTGMKSIRTDYETEWKDIARFAQPARSRFLSNDANKGAKRRQSNRKLMDSHGIEAFRTLTNGMTSGLSSASRPWFSLTVEDEDLAESGAVKAWLSDVERRMYSFLAKTNFYSAVKTGYAEMGLFGTEATVMMEHREHGAVCHPLTAGEYWIGLSDAQVPDSLYRTCPMSVRQAMQSFGDKVSKRVRQCYDKSNYDEMVDVYQAIEVNDDHIPGKLGSKPWRSIYWDNEDGPETVLREAGFDEQPFWAPRWDVTGGDVYGYSPGMEALPALRELQLQVKRRNEAIDLMVHPEKIVPVGMRLTGQPRSVVTASNVDKDSVLIPYQMPYQAVAAIGEEVVKCKEQINSLSYADLFNAITNMQGIQPRNIEEIASRNEEKLTQLGPVIERVSNEKLEVAIDRTFGIMLRGQMLAEPPEELSGVALKVEFVSILTQMQRMVGIGQIERTTSFIGNLAGAIPDVLDKLNGDEMIDEYAYRAGAPAKIIRGADEVAKIRQARAEQQAQQQTMASMPAMKQGADAARLLSETDVGGEPLIDTLLGA